MENATENIKITAGNIITEAQMLDIYSAIHSEDYGDFLAETNADNTTETLNRFLNAKSTQQKLNNRGITDEMICNMVA